MYTTVVEVGPQNQAIWDPFPEWPLKVDPLIQGRKTGMYFFGKMPDLPKSLD